MVEQTAISQVTNLIEYGFAAFGMGILTFIVWYLLKANNEVIRKNTDAINELTKAMRDVCGYRYIRGRLDSD